MRNRLILLGGLCLALGGRTFGQGTPTKETAVIQDAPPQVAQTAPLKGPAEIHVDWSSVQGVTTARMFALDGFKAGNPVVAANPAYQSGLADMGVGSLRYHTANSLSDSKSNEDGWLDVSNKRWDSEKILAAMKAWNPPGMVKIVNIVGWPEWMDQNKDRFLDKDKYDAFAEFCADLVRILNVEGGLGIQYFEITNEKDGLYWIDSLQNKQPDHIADLADIYNRAATAMKKIDPTIKTGGPAAMRPDRGEPLFQWIKAVQPNLDFLSVHMYASGDPKDPDIHIFDRTETMGAAAGKLRKFLDDASPDRKIELHVNEFNISWTWETRDVRMTNHVGAVFDALSLVQLATNGADIINAWNECDGVYGKMGGDMVLRPPAKTFRLFNRHLIGERVAATSSQPRRVIPFAVKGSQGFNLLLINRNAQEREVVLATTGWTPPGNPATLSRIQASGYTEEQVFDAPGWAEGKPFVLPANSVTVLHWRD